MDTEIASLFFSLLSLVALAGAAAIVVFGALYRFTPLGDRMGALRSDLGRMAVPLAFVVALVCTAGSLFYSEVATFVPCKLCWFQRCAMYSLTVFLGVAAFRRSRSVRFYVVPQAVVGIAVSVYHSTLQWFPDTSSTFCTPDAPCTERHVFEFGFVTIPFMALCGFAAIIALMFLAGGPEAPGWADDAPDLPASALARHVALPLGLACAVVAVPGVVGLVQAIGADTLVKTEWFPRTALFPLVLMSAIATARRDASVRWYVVPVAAFGAVAALFDRSLLVVPFVACGALAWWAGRSAPVGEPEASPRLATA